MDATENGTDLVFGSTEYKYQEVWVGNFIPGIWYEMILRSANGGLVFWQRLPVYKGELIGVAFQVRRPSGKVVQQYLKAPVSLYDRVSYPICRLASVTWAEYCTNAYEVRRTI